MTAVIFSDLEFAHAFVCFDEMFDHRAYVCRETGKIYMISDDDEDEEDDDLPDDLGNSDRYIEVPDQRDLDLGQVLVMEFMDQRMPDDYDLVVGFFRKRGAFGRFKDFLDSKGQLDAWRQFENEAVQSALREWCVRNGLEIAEGPAADQGGS